MKAEEEMLRQINKWIDYAEEAIAEANQSTWGHVQWVEFADCKIFSDFYESESASDCEDDEEEHFAFYDWLSKNPAFSPPHLLDPAEEQSAKPLSMPLLLRNSQTITVDNEDSSSDSDDSETDYTNRIEELQKISNWLKNLGQFERDHSRRKRKV